MRKKLLFALTALFVCSAANAAYMKIAGVEITELNYQDIRGDGSVSYDPLTNTLSLNNFNYAPTVGSNPMIEVSETGTGLLVSSPKEKALTIKCINTCKVATSSNEPSIEYDGTLNVTGSGVLSLSNKGTAIKCSRLNVTGGSVLNLKSEGSNITLVGDTLEVSYSVLNVIAGDSASVGIISDMQVNYLTGTWSEHQYMMWSETERKRVRYKYSYNNSSHTYEYRYRTETKTHWYKGWYHFNENKGKVRSTDVDIYPEVYPIIVNGVQVDRYNYLNVLNDGTVAYNPLTKTLTTSKDVEVKYEGYLIINKSANNTVTSEEKISETTENFNLENTIPVAPGYENKCEYTNTGISPSIQFYYVSGSYEVQGSGEIAFDSLVSGHIYYNDDTRTLTFDNAVLNNTGLQIMHGDKTTIELIGDNFFNDDWNEDITLYDVNVAVKGTGSLTANEIYDVKCDSLTIEGGCSVNINNSHGWGVLTINKSTVNFNGGEYGTLAGYPEVRLNGSHIANPDSAYYYSYVEPQKDGSFYRGGYLVVSSQKVVVYGIASIEPDASCTPIIRNDMVFDPQAPKYDVQGRRVGSGYKGIYIQGGKKFKQEE